MLNMISLNQLILRTDVSGMPLEWIHFQTAVKLYYSEQVAYTCGTPILSIRGGVNAKTGRVSRIDLNSIIATYGSKQQLHEHYVPPLNNPLLFRRDDYICLYCGGHFLERDLSRDHVHPQVLGGRDVWTNVVSACKHCNSRKGGAPRSRRTCRCWRYLSSQLMRNTFSCKGAIFSPTRWNSSVRISRVAVNCVSGVRRADFSSAGTGIFSYSHSMFTKEFPMPASTSFWSWLLSLFRRSPAPAATPTAPASPPVAAPVTPPIPTRPPLGVPILAPVTPVVAPVPSDTAAVIEELRDVPPVSVAPPPPAFVPQGDRLPPPRDDTGTPPQSLPTEGPELGFPHHLE